MALGAALFSLNTLAQMTPLGTWHTIDDETKKPKGEVRITLSPSGGLSGVVEKSLMPMPDVDPLCNLCNYSARLTPIEGGKKMEMRGYMGTPLVGRSQIWIRVN